MNLLRVARDLISVEEVLRHGAKAVTTIVIAWVLYLIVRRAVRTATRAAEARIEEEAQRQRVTTLLLLAGSVAKYAIIFFFGIMVLDDLNLNPTPVLAGAGIFGLAVGFGAQNLVRDVVSGFFIIMEGQYALGDLVEINGVFGQVEEVGLRTTKIRDPNGELRFFPNGTIGTANNYTEDHVAYVINIPLPVGEPTDPAALVRAILQDFEREFRVFSEPPVLSSAEDLPTYSRLLRVKAHVIPGRQALMEQKLPARVTAAFQRAGNPIPPGTDVTVSLRYPPSGARLHPPGVR
jgi:small-conductance mechanosensitive channel